MTRNHLLTLSLAAALAGAQASPPAQAQAWPSRLLTMVVPSAAGGPIDVIGRILAPRMSEILGQQVVVENVPGAGGMIGSARVARASPDGYKFVLGAAGQFAQAQTLYKHPQYNAVSDFTPVGLIAEAPAILVVRKDFPAGDFKEFMAYARANQDKLQFGSGGAGSGPHTTCLLLNSAIGINVTHVPYRGIAPAYQDLIGGRFDYMCDFVATALPQIQGGTVKAIATLTRERTAVLPNLPTAHEYGLANLDAPGWYALLLPKGAPEMIVHRLSKAMSDAVESPAVRQQLLSLGTVVVAPERRTPEYLAQFIPSEIEKWAAPIKASGVFID